MTAASEQPQVGSTHFRAKMLATMMAVVAVITALGLYITQRNLANDVEREMESQFQAELGALQNLLDVRNAALTERCRSLVRKPRIHAALEDNGLDLLYMTAEDELRDILAPAGGAALPHPLHAEFYRFLEARGSVIPQGALRQHRELGPLEESQLALPSITLDQQSGFMVKSAGTLSEILAVPILSTETGEPIAALVLGFKPMSLSSGEPNREMKSGVLVQSRLYAPSLEEPARRALEELLLHQTPLPKIDNTRLKIAISGIPQLVFCKRLNPQSSYPPAWEVCVFSLSNLLAKQERLRWEIISAGAMMMLAGLGASHLSSARLSAPVEKLAVDSEANRIQRMRAEMALDHTHAELQRSARFSANASHQLKTPVTVLRAGLEELLAREHLSPEAREEVSQLIHQTYRLSGVIEDLLLLSRLDAGQLKLAVSRVNLARIIEAELDDVDARSGTLGLAIQSAVPESAFVSGEQRYTTMIVRNLLENAQKYNRPEGTIRVSTRTEGAMLLLTIGNTGRAIPPGAQEHVFERFHRGAAEENIPGHGLGLNLARELARLQGGDLRLVRSDESWTEFETSFCLANNGGLDPA